MEDASRGIENVFHRKRRKFEVVSFLGLVCILISVLTLNLRADEPFIKGIDLSILQRAQDDGVEYRENNVVEDPIRIFKDNGCNYVRLRLFVNPSGKDGQVNTLAYTLRLAKRVKAAGFPLLLDFHYSDAWADAGRQSIPEGWANLSEPALVQRVYDYTFDTIQQFTTEGCRPDMVAVGNEITNGMMWPAGGPLSGEAKWPGMIALLKSGISAVRHASLEHPIRVMIHVDRGGSADVCGWFFSHCARANVDFDVIGLSYYPFWHGTLADLKNNMAQLSKAYGKDIIVAETGYDSIGEQGKMEFPTTPQGQKQFLQALMRTIRETPGGHGKGLFYWEPAWIDGRQWNGPTWSDVWERRALFDAQGNARPALQAFGPQ